MLMRMCMCVCACDGSERKKKARTLCETNLIDITVLKLQILVLSPKAAHTPSPVFT